MDGLSIAASLGEVRAAVEGGFVDTIYQPTRSAIVLYVSGAGKARILISPRAAAIHVTELSLPNPSTPSAFVMFLRRHLRGGRILAVRQRGWDRVAMLEIERRNGRDTRIYELVAELTGLQGNLHLVKGGAIVGSAYYGRRSRPGDAYVSIRPQVKLDPEHVTMAEIADVLRGEAGARALVRSIDGIGRHTAEDTLAWVDDRSNTGGQAAAIHSALRTILSYVGSPSPHVIASEGRATFYPPPVEGELAASFGMALDAVSDAASEDGASDRSPVHDALRRQAARHRRTLEKLAEWLDGADEADRLQALADLLMIHHKEVAPKAAEVVVTDPATKREIAIRLVPSLSAIGNAQRLYERAKRLRRGRPHVVSRIERLRSELRAFEEALQDIDAGRAVDERAIRLLPGKRAAGPAPQASRHRLDVEGFAILIGRSARDNDRLLREAAPDDLWLHVKGFAGSHVVVKRGGRKEIPDSVVGRAARLAAEHSKAAGERRVEVLVTQAKHVQKPKGAADGLANVTGAATLTVEM